MSQWALFSVHGRGFRLLQAAWKAKACAPRTASLKRTTGKVGSLNKTLEGLAAYHLGSQCNSVIYVKLFIFHTNLVYLESAIFCTKTASPLCCYQYLIPSVRRQECMNDVFLQKLSCCCDLYRNTSTEASAKAYIYIYIYVIYIYIYMYILEVSSPQKGHHESCGDSASWC